MWSIGCIFAELMMKRTLFPGEHNMRQLDKIIEVLGYPQDEDLDFITNEASMSYMKRLKSQQHQTINWKQRIPHASADALDLLVKMLRFSPEHRITVKDAIKHPYFKNFESLGDPPRCETVFDWTWDKFELSKELL